MFVSSIEWPLWGKILIGWGWRTACRTAEKTKKPSSHIHGTKAVASAIPPKLAQNVPARFPRHHAYPMDNGWDPVGIYWDDRLFKPPSEGHSPSRSPPRSHHPGLSWGSLCKVTLLPHRFVCLVIGTHYRLLERLCQEKMRKNFCGIFGNRKKEQEKGAAPSLSSLFHMAQREGFEPSCGCPQTDFEFCRPLTKPPKLQAFSGTIIHSKMPVFQEFFKKILVFTGKSV